MKRYKVRVLAVLLVLFLMGQAAHAQAVTPSPPTLQSLQQELQRMQDMMRELERQINLQQRATAGQGQRGGGVPVVGNVPFVGNVPVLNRRAVRIETAYGDVLNSQGGGAWWANTALVARLGLSDDQKLKIERVYESHRQNLVSSKDALEKEEAQLAKLLEADPLDRTASVAQIYKVVQARGEMEKTNSLMTFEMREVLTRAQWTQLQAQTPLGINIDYTISTVRDPAGAVGVRGRGLGAGTSTPFGVAPAVAPTPAGTGGQRSGRGQ